MGGASLRPCGGIFVSNMYYRKYKKYNRQPDLLDLVVDRCFELSQSLASLIFKSKASNSKPEIITESRYFLKHSLLTPTEKEFLKVLEQVVGNHYRIEAQVPLSAIVKPIDSNARYTNYGDFNKIRAKSIDYVLYDKDYVPCLAIELDDYTHLQSNRIERDHFIDEVMRGVGLRIMHVPVAYIYDQDFLRNIIFESQTGEHNH